MCTIFICFGSPSAFLLRIKRNLEGLFLLLPFFTVNGRIVEQVLLQCVYLASRFSLFVLGGGIEPLCGSNSVSLYFFILW